MGVWEGECIHDHGYAGGAEEVMGGRGGDVFCMWGGGAM